VVSFGYSGLTGALALRGWALGESALGDGRRALGRSDGVFQVLVHSPDVLKNAHPIALDCVLERVVVVDAGFVRPEGFVVERGFCR